MADNMVLSGDVNTAEVVCLFVVVYDVVGGKKEGREEEEGESEKGYGG